MSIDLEFSKNALSYSSYNIIQSKVVKKLVNGIDSNPKKIIDLGCGEGAVFREITWNISYFIGIDFAKNMLELHPKDKNIECIYGNFNDSNLFDSLYIQNMDYLISASALQWADDLDKVFKNIKNLDIPISLAIFTSGTFETINRTASLKPLLRSVSEVKNTVDRYFDVEYELLNYKLEFKSTREMFRYIKKSGVSASRNVLNYKNTKKLMNEYPYKYLEFEILLIKSI